MLLLSNAHYSCVEKACLRTIRKFIDQSWPVLESVFNATVPTQTKSPVTQDQHVVMTTRRGVRVVASRDEVCFYGPKSMIRMDWIGVPAIIASLRSALVPLPQQTEVHSSHVDAALDMASSFGENTECLFTVADAEDIVQGYSLVHECPYPRVAGEISHVLKIGSKKLYRYIENEIEQVEAN